ncbi:MAG: ATP-binding protein [Bacilli bacterium]
MGTGYFFPISALPFSILMLYLFFCRKHIDTNETKIYGTLIVINFFGLLIELACNYASYIYTSNHMLSVFILKMYLIYLVTWLFIFTIYTLLISFGKKIISSNDKILNAYVLFFYVLIIAIIFALPVELIMQSNNLRYSTGASVYFTYFLSGCFVLAMLFSVIKNYKNLKNKKYLPLFIFLIMGSCAMAIQLLYPGILLMTYFETFVMVVMFNTIENPDVKMIEELNIANDTAVKANAAKTDFLSNMSHEIRTPLNAIVGFSNLLLDDKSVNDGAKDEIKDIIMASDNLLEIVNGILDISKIEANKLEIINTEYSFKKIVNDLIILTKGRLGDKPLEFRTHIDESIPPVLYGDYSRVKQICVNILTNAVKYTKEGFIDFTISSVMKDNVVRLIISVEDSGIGIKEGNIDKLFNKFERLDLNDNVTIEGTGLGLAITKKLVDLMHGKIVVQSVYGKGSKFTVALDQKIVKNPSKNLEYETKKLETVKVKNKIVLLVDDNLINLKVAERLLDAYSITTESVSSGYLCIDLIKEGKKYDLILLDDMMPKLSGVETLKKLKNIDGFNTPTVALTANALTGMKEKYLKDGFNDYLAKPIDKVELNKIINKYLVD